MPVRQLLTGWFDDEGTSTVATLRGAEPVQPRVWTKWRWQPTLTARLSAPYAHR